MGQKKLILVVEDDPDILESVKILLEWKGYAVSTLSDGKTALPAAVQNQPALIIMDVMMPPPNGIEVCRALKSDARTQKIPLLLLSARTQKADVETGFNAGADMYLPKPFQNEEILAAVARLTQ